MGKNLSASPDGLGPTEVMRGGYMNSGSKDIGPDPDWDHKTGTWHGKRLDLNTDSFARKPYSKD